MNDTLGYKKKAVVVTSDPLALVAEKTKITALLAKALNRKKYYAKPTNNNLRTSSASFFANKKPEYVKSVEKKVDKKVDEKKRDMSKTKMLLAKKDSDEQVLLAEDQAWMESSSDSDQEINANMVFMTQIEKVLSDSDESSSSAKETIVEKRIEKANQQSKDLENQDKDLQEKYDVLINHVNTFEEKNNEFNKQIKVLNKKNADLLIQMEVLQYQLKVKHVVIDTHTECQAQYAKLKEERYEYIIRYYALCDNDKKHRKKIDEQEILFDKMSRQLIEMNNNVLRLQEKIIEKEMKISELECHSKLNKDVKRYSRKDLLSCNNSHLGETSSAYVCNHATNVSCNSRFCDSFDENNLFIFDDESVRISPVSKIPFRKKLRDSINVRSMSNLHKSLLRTVHRCYLLNDYEDAGKLKEKGDIRIFVGYSKESAAFRIYNKRTLSQVSETSKRDFEDLFQKFYDEYFDSSKIMKSLTTNVETFNDEIHSNEEEVFHESFESFQEESSLSSMNDDVQQSSKEVRVPSSNTQSNNMIPNVDKGSTSHNVFNERLEDAYFDSTEALKDADWVSEMQDELD
nr:retrovirus-related Pol polyprotein from transposon TNT 1-94 [Tanacetum cinerariifolium]